MKENQLLIIKDKQAQFLSKLMHVNNVQNNGFHIIGEPMEESLSARIPNKRLKCKL